MHDCLENPTSRRYILSDFNIKKKKEDGLFSCCKRKKDDDDVK